MVMMISDETGEGKMTVHQILPGIMICFTDMHMEQCMSEFELNSGQKVLCIDQCREGRIEMEKIRAIHEQITSNLQVRVTIEELSKQYDMPATSMKKCFREIYGDSIYSYQKRYRMNVAANLLMEDSKVEIQEIALKMGYENPGKFSSAFKSVMGVTPAKYRKQLKRSANRSLFFQKFFNIVSGLILFNLAIAAAHFIERTFVVRGKYNINKEKIKYIDKKI